MRGTRLLAIGSSSLESPSTSLVRALVAEGWDVQAFGVRGADARGLLARLDGVQVVRGDHVLVYVPHNGGSSLEEVSRLEAALIARGALTVWAEPPEWPASSPADVVRAALSTRAAIRRAGVRRIASPPLAPTDLGPDRVHLSESGARMLARRWTAQLRASSFAAWWLPTLLAAVIFALIK